MPPITECSTSLPTRAEFTTHVLAEVRDHPNAHNGDQTDEQAIFDEGSTLFVLGKTIDKFHP